MADPANPLKLSDTFEPPPEIPRPRTFLVRQANDPDGKPNSSIVEAHQVEITSNGDLLFFAFTFNLTPQGYAPNSLLRRAFAKGEWKDMVETMIPATGLIVH